MGCSGEWEESFLVFFGFDFFFWGGGAESDFHNVGNV